MDKGSLVYSQDFGCGIIEKISPSKSLIEVRFEDFPQKVVLSSTLELVTGI